MFHIFVYGTLKKGFPNYFHVANNKIGQVKFLYEAATKAKYPLVAHSLGNLPYLLNCKGEGHNVLGEVFEVDEKALKWLHDFEDVGNWYDCIEIDTVSLEGNIGTKCFCYVKHGDTAELLKQDHYEVYSLELANTYISGFVKGNKF